MGDGRDERSLDERLAPQDFVSDFVWAARAVLNQPSVALVSIILWCLPTAMFVFTPQGSTAGVLVLLGVCLFLSGWIGIERIFFLAHREGKQVAFGHLLASVPFFIGRFARLGFLFALMTGIFTAIIGAIVNHFHPAASAASRLAARRTEILVVMVPADVALTFVTSALAFSTRSAREALRIGFRMIRQTWPRSALYVLCPPMALNMLNAIYPTSIPAVRLLSTAGLAVLALLAKGATAAFYLRDHPISADVVGDAL